jgi:RHS repeat-associated protein
MDSFSINGVLQASYKYDAMGRQAIRTLSSPTAVTIHSVFDSEGRRIAEYNEGTGALIREYVWNGWDPVAVIEGGVVSFVRADHIGRPVFATNPTGAKVWSATYNPFGGVHTSTGALPPNRFPGQWFQSESGLHQNWMRDYDPTTGRYLQADPLGLVDGASVYGYVGGNPGRYIDPTGEFAAGGAAIGAGVSLGLQMFVNMWYGNMNFWQAVNCINLVPVFNGAILGGFGASPIALYRSGRGAATAAGAAGFGAHFNRVSPDWYLGGNECGECKLPEAPDWVRALRDVLL